MESGNNLTDITEKYCVGRSTARNIVQIICISIWPIWQIIQDECIPHTSVEKWLEIAEVFQKTTHFPYCIGAIDGKHVRIRKPYYSGSKFFLL